jgi:CRP/FNR family cyclic AMP-dependent transcriptional regulator
LKGSPQCRPVTAPIGTIASSEKNLAEYPPAPNHKSMNPANLFKHDTDTTNLAQGEVLFTQGEPGDCMYVLLEGSADIIVNQEVVERSTSGSLLGEMALIDNSPRAATVIAAETCRLAKVDERRFNFIIQNNPFFAKHVMTVLVNRVRQMSQLRGTPTESLPDLMP